MPLPPQLLYVALAVGMTALATAFVGAYRRSRLLVLCGQLVVSGHALMYFYGSGWNWILGIGCVSMLAGALVYRPNKDGPWLFLWLLLTLPPAAVYLLFIGIGIIYILAKGP